MRLASTIIRTAVFRNSRLSNTQASHFLPLSNPGSSFVTAPLVFKRYKSARNKFKNKLAKVPDKELFDTTNTNYDVRLAGFADPKEKPVAVQPEKIREIDHMRASEDALKLETRSKDELLRAKFDKTPLTPERQAEIDEHAQTFMQILLTPQTPSTVIKKERVSITREDFDLEYFFSKYPRDDVHYNKYIRGVAERGNVGRALAAINDMKKHGIRPTVYCFTSLLVAFSAERRSANSVLRVIEMMNENGVKPNLWTYAALIRAILQGAPKTYIGITEKALDRAFDVVEMVKQTGLKPDVVIFTSLVKGCLMAKDLKRAWATFDHMRTWNCEPDVVLFSLMIAICARTGETERALGIMDEMKQLHMTPTEVTYENLIKAFIHRPDMYSEVFKVLNDMKAAGYAPSKSTFRELMRCAEKSGDCRTAELIHDEIMRFPFQERTPYVYGKLIESYANAHRTVDYKKGLSIEGNIKKGEAIWEKMLSNGVRPTIAVMNSVLSLYAEGLRLNRTLEWLEKYKEYGFEPNFITYNILIKMHTRSKNMERAFDLFNLMKLKGFVPTRRTYGNLIFGCARTFFVTSGMRLLREMKENGYVLEPHYDFVLNFRRNLVKSPHLIREIDELTGKAYRYVPGWKKAGGRKPRSLRRVVTKEEEKVIRRGPVWLAPSQIHPHGHSQSQ